MPKPNRAWISEAISHEGILREYARKQDKLTNRGTIDVRFLHQLAQRNDVIGHRARLAITLQKLRNRN
jgi:hypothetical protein